MITFTPVLLIEVCFGPGVWLSDSLSVKTVHASKLAHQEQRQTCFAPEHVYFSKAKCFFSVFWSFAFVNRVSAQWRSSGKLCPPLFVVIAVLTRGESVLTLTSLTGLSTRLDEASLFHLAEEQKWTNVTTWSNTNTTPASVSSLLLASSQVCDWTIRLQVQAQHRHLLVRCKSGPASLLTAASFIVTWPVEHLRCVCVC